MDGKTHAYRMDLKPNAKTNFKMKNWFSKSENLKRILLVFFLSILIFSSENIIAQDTLPIPINLNADKEYKTEKKKTIDKLFQALKFKQNRDNSEKQRVYEFIQQLIEQGDLNIDSAVVVLKKNINDLKNELKTNTDNDANKIDSIKIKIKILDSLVTKVQDSSKIALDKKLNKKRNDIIKQKENRTLTDRQKILKLRDLSINCKCLENTNSENETIESCLKIDKKIIGWHNLNSNPNYKNYNFHYLSVLNLESYELDTNGTAKNLDELEESQKIIDFAQKNCTDVYLTVHNKSKEQISTFLKSYKAQNTLCESLKKYTNSNKIIGVNIFFENINSNDSDAFVQFIRDLNQNFKKTNTNFELTITIPGVYDRISLEKVEAYDFLQLNELVTNYIVLTNKMILTDSPMAGPNSPLQNENDLGLGTIKSALDFYSNNKIPLNKLVLSVSYLGLEWPVVNFEGKVKKGDYGNEIQYNLIQERIQEYKGTNNRIEQNFDSIKATAYLDITEDTTYFEPTLSQIWYENSESLRLKYEWMLENNLAGVSIFGLGYDDGYTDLWDALALTLINTKKNKTTAECYDTILSKNYSYYDHLSSILNDSTKKFFDNFQKNHSVNSDTTLLNKFKSDYEWSNLPSLAYKTESYPLNETNEPDLLNDKETCLCLLKRWYFYSYSLFLVASLLLVLVVFLSFRIYRFNKYREKISPTTYENYKSYRIVLLILVYILILIGLFLYPNEPLILGKDGIVTRNLVIIVSIGFSLGVWGLYTIFNGSYIKKDLP